MAARKTVIAERLNLKKHTKLFLARFDGRIVTGCRFKEMVAAITDDLGGPENITENQR